MSIQIANPFAALPPVPEVLNLAGEQVDITPLKVGELPAFARALRPVLARLSPDPDWLVLSCEGGESVIQALAIASRRPTEWVATLALDEAIQLAEAVFGANADFFIRRVAPEVARVSERIGTLMAGKSLGPTPSTACLAPGTASPTS